VDKTRRVPARETKRVGRQTGTVANPVTRTGRVTSRLAAGDTRRGAAPAPGAGLSPGLKAGIGVAAGVLALLLLVLVMSGGSSGDGRARKASDRFQARLAELDAARQAGQDGRAVEMIEDLLRDDAFRGNRRYAECRTLLDQYRLQLERNRTAAERVRALQQTVEAARANNTALQQAAKLLVECQDLLARYGDTPSATDLRGLRDDLRRWAATDSQSGWTDSYNALKDRIATEHLRSGDFAAAIRAWRAFENGNPDPLLRSRVSGEVSAINRMARDKASALVREGEPGDLRSRIESARPRFDGSEGMDVLNAALGGR
jgi:hypothetical protein